MKYGMMPRAMWMMFGESFARAAQSKLGVSDGRKLMRKAKNDYRRILEKVDEFDPDSRFAVNIMSCAMLIAVLKNVSIEPEVEAVRSFYRSAMCENRLMKLFMKKSNTYTQKGQEKLRNDAIRSLQRDNPYDWKFTYEPGESMNQYTVIFTTCGICTLMKEYGLFKYVPAMCSLDYDMAEMNGTKFTRQFTLASGGAYCDCHYHHENDDRKFHKV